jgi:ribosome-associated protein
VGASTPVRDVDVRGTIRLGQFLKLSGLVEHGADAKDVVAAGGVTVNGRAETRRGRQLADGDVVALGGERARVIEGRSEPSSPL